MNITSQQLEQIYSQGLSMDIVWILQLLDKEVIIIEEASDKVKNYIQTCLRKQLITEDLKLTLKGQEVIKQLIGGEEIKAKKREKSQFDFWWEIYPSTNCFSVKGKSFDGTQKKNIRKDDCRAKFNKYVESGEFTAEDIISATQFHIQMCMDQSFKKKENQLTFCPNSLRYINEKYFEPYIRLSKISKNLDKIEQESPMDTII